MGPTKIKKEWEEEEAAEDEGTAAIEGQIEEIRRDVRSVTITIPDDDDENALNGEEAVRDEVAEVIDLTEEDDESDAGNDEDVDPRPYRPLRNPPIQFPSVILTEVERNDDLIKPGAVVEVDLPNIRFPFEERKLFKAEFLLVKQIYKVAHGEIKIRGIAMTRTRNLRGQLPRLRNELIMLLNVDEDDDRDPEVQALLTVTLDDIIRKRICNFTNATFPQFRDEIPSTTKTWDDIATNGALLCRWRYTFTYRDAISRTWHRANDKKAAPHELIIEHLAAKEIPKRRFRVEESHRLNTWRGSYVPGGEYGSGKEDGVFIPLDDDEDQGQSETKAVVQRPGQKYTFGDMFCGAGGASCGAEKAGFYVKLGCDNHGGACNTYSLVFPNATLYKLDVFDYIKEIDDISTRVDIMHLSPPCQFWSPAHTVEGQDDEKNIAVLFSCRELVQKMKPRLFTLEQTFGICHPKFEYYFNALVHGFTQSSYSVRWKITDLVHLGSPARRQRLLMIGACPGEDLPAFPEYTHVDRPTPGKKKFVTVQNVLSKIKIANHRDDVMHKPMNMADKKLTPWNPNITLSRCITTNGGVGNYHPSGRRDFTHREYATLQTFPVHYPFQTPDRKRQIGNAFPPMVVKNIYKHLLKCLEKRDGVVKDNGGGGGPAGGSGSGHRGGRGSFDQDDAYCVVVPSDDDDDDDDDDAVQFTGSRLRVHEVDDDDEEDGDAMDVDTGDDDDDDAVMVGCADANQMRVWSPIDLSGEMSE